MKTWMKRRDDGMKIISGKYAGHQGSVESNVYQRTMDYPHEWGNGHQIMPDTEESVTVRWDKVESLAWHSNTITVVRIAQSTDFCLP